MKENTKIIIACVITLILGTIINVTATPLLQANSVSYKTSNGDTTDVNSALDRLFDINTVNQRLGNTDIGDKTITGAISDLNISIDSLGSGYIDTTNLLKTITDRAEIYTATEDCIAIGYATHDGDYDFVVYIDNVEVIRAYSGSDNVYLPIKKGQTLSFRQAGVQTINIRIYSAL